MGVYDSYDLSNGGLLYWGVNENNLTNPEYKDRFVQFEDHVFTFVSVAIFLVILISLVLDFYKKQNRELVQTGEILKKQIQMIESEKQKKRNSRTSCLACSSVRSNCKSLRLLSSTSCSACPDTRKLSSPEPNSAVRIADGSQLNRLTSGHRRYRRFRQRSSAPRDRVLAPHRMATPQIRDDTAIHE